jgi:threonine/homoserine/homoserine lactone efflux protein
MKSVESQVPLTMTVFSIAFVLIVFGATQNATGKIVLGNVLMVLGICLLVYGGVNWWLLKGKLETLDKQQRIDDQQRHDELTKLLTTIATNTKK